jgi:hypothetical protein
VADAQRHGRRQIRRGNAGARDLLDANAELGVERQVGRDRLLGLDRLQTVVLQLCAGSRREGLSARGNAAAAAAVVSRTGVVLLARSWVVHTSCGVFSVSAEGGGRERWWRGVGKMAHVCFRRDTHHTSRSR